MYSYQSKFRKNIVRQTKNYQIVNKFPIPNENPLICVMKIIEIAKNMAVPSKLVLQPMGMTNLVILGSILSSLSMMSMFTGRAAAVDAAAKAVRVPKKMCLKECNLINIIQKKVTKKNGRNGFRKRTDHNPTPERQKSFTLNYSQIILKRILPHNQKIHQL